MSVSIFLRASPKGSTRPLIASWRFPRSPSASARSLSKVWRARLKKAPLWSCITSEARALKVSLSFSRASSSTAFSSASFSRSDLSTVSAFVRPVCAQASSLRNEASSRSSFTTCSRSPAADASAAAVRACAREFARSQPTTSPITRPAISTGIKREGRLIVLPTLGGGAFRPAFSLAGSVQEATCNFKLRTPGSGSPGAAQLALSRYADVQGRETQTGRISFEVGGQRQLQGHRLRTLDRKRKSIGLAKMHAQGHQL